jgi:hypothetical protein
MLDFITNLDHPVLEFVCDDPVRPEISKEFRVGPGRFVGALIDDKPRAIVCVNFLDRVPEAVADLGEAVGAATVAVFYTIWSYKPGAGQELLNATVERIKKEFPSITRFVTLSPKTEMARRFHLKNGAVVLRENADTINYEYRPRDPEIVKWERAIMKDEYYDVNPD